MHLYEREYRRLLAFVTSHGLKVKVIPLKLDYGGAYVPSQNTIEIQEKGPKDSWCDRIAYLAHEVGHYYDELYSHYDDRAEKSYDVQSESSEKRIKVPERHIRTVLAIEHQASRYGLQICFDLRLRVPVALVRHYLEWNEISYEHVMRHGKEHTKKARLKIYKQLTVRNKKTYSNRTFNSYARHPIR